jgi:hypothetical protein
MDIKLQTLSILLLLLSLFASSTASAKQVQQGTEPADPVREQAKNLVYSAAMSAKDLNSPLAQVRVLAEAGDLMWEFDKDMARDLFRQSGERALAINDEVDEKAKREAVMDLATRLKRRDQKLFDWFISKLEQQAKDKKKADAANERRDITGASSVRGRVLLDLARQKLESKKFDEAAQLLGESFVDGVMQEHGFYLRILASLDSGLALKAFQSGLEALQSLPTHELADVLTMASFLFDMQGTSVGGRTITHYAKPSLVKPPPDLIHRFLILAREAINENAALVQGQQLASLREDTATTRRPQVIYLAVEQLLPFFEAYWPEAVPELLQVRGMMLTELRAQNIAPKEVPDFSSPSWRGATDDPSNDEIEKELERAKKAPTEYERDDLYFSATIHALWRQKLSQAQVAARAISDPFRGQRARSLVRLAQLREAWKNKDIASANRIIESIEDPSLKVQALVWLAERFKEKDYISNVVELLSYATSTAAKVEDSLARSQSFLAISKSALKTDPILAFESMQAAIKSLAKVKTISIKDVHSTGGEFGMPRVTKLGPSGIIKEAEAQAIDFDLFGTLTELAAKDFYRTLGLVDTIESLEIKLYGRLAIARGQIIRGNAPDKKGKQTPNNRSEL